jgi:hypothetical protein
MEWGQRAAHPHCDDLVLHAPGECRYCDEFPERQAMRFRNGVNFTGKLEYGKRPCPSTERRPLEVIERWHGNVPVKTGGEDMASVNGGGGEGHLLPPVLTPIPDGTALPRSKREPEFTGDPDDLPSDYPAHESVIDRRDQIALDKATSPTTDNLANAQDAALEPHRQRARSILSTLDPDEDPRALEEAVARLCQQEASALEQARVLGEENERLQKALTEAPKKGRQRQEPGAAKLRLTVTNFEHQVENLQQQIRRLESENTALRNAREAGEDFVGFLEKLAEVSGSRVLAALARVQRVAPEAMQASTVDLIAALLDERTRA